MVHTHGVESLAWSPDGHTLATASRDIILWNVTGRDRPQRIGNALGDHPTGVTSLRWSPDGRTVAAASGESTVILWSVADLNHPQPPWRPLTGHTSHVWSVAWSPDGHTLATAGADSTVILWDLTDRGRPQRIGAPLTGHSDWILSVAWSPDGHTLATASNDDTVLLWDLAGLYELRDQAVARACMEAGGGLTENEWATSVHAALSAHLHLNHHQIPRKLRLAAGTNYCRKNCSPLHGSSLLE